MDGTFALRRGLYWVGSGLAIVGIGFVVHRLHAYWLEIDFSRVTASTWFFLALFAATYGLSNVLLASAWHCLLRQLGVAVSRAWAMKAYAVSQLAKYLPGNIFHFAGRQALGMAAGLPAGQLAKSALWELGLIAVGGAVFGCLALSLLFPGMAHGLGVLSFMASLALVMLGLRKAVGKQTVQAFARQIAFLALSGAIFVGLLALICTEPSIGPRSWLTIAGAYVVAWLAGLVAIGAPAGVGVREMVLLLLLKGVVVEVDLLLAVVLGRLVTVTGDFLFFAASPFMSAKAEQVDDGCA